MKAITESLFSSNAVLFNAKYANGFIAPIYLDIRLTLSTVNERNTIERALAQLINQYYVDCNLIAGTCTSGIPHAAIVAHILGLPMCYVRTNLKDHGLGKKIEGNITEGQKAVVIEDVVAHGGSALEIASTLKKAGANVLGVASVFSFNMKKGIENFTKQRVIHYSLTNFDAVVNLALEKGIINHNEYELLYHYRDNTPEIAWE